MLLALGNLLADRPAVLRVPVFLGDAMQWNLRRYVGGADVLVRILTRHMADDLGQVIVVQNQPGAGGAIAFGQLARAAPDGYTLAWTSAGFAVMAVTLSLASRVTAALMPAAGIFLNKSAWAPPLISCRAPFSLR